MFDIFVYIMMGMLGILLVVLFVAKKRIDNNEPIAGWRRKQYLEEVQAVENPNNEVKPTKTKHQKEDNEESIKELIGIKDVKYGIFEKSRNEYSIIISTDSVNFDLLNPAEQGTIILGYQALFRVIKFPIQILGQSVRQDLRKDEARFRENLQGLNDETRDYNERVIRNIKDRSENHFRLSKKMYYVISYIYEPSKLGKLNPQQKERKIVEQLYNQAGLLIRMLRRARIEAEVLDSLQAIELLKRALNRDRMLLHPIETIIEDKKEKITPYVTGDPSTFPGFDELVQDVEEAMEFVTEE